MKLHVSHSILISLHANHLWSSWITFNPIWQKITECLCVLWNRLKTMLSSIIRHKKIHQRMNHWKSGFMGSATHKISCDLISHLAYYSCQDLPVPLSDSWRFISFLASLSLLLSFLPPVPSSYVINQPIWCALPIFYSSDNGSFLPASKINLSYYSTPPLLRQAQSLMTSVGMAPSSVCVVHLPQEAQYVAWACRETSLEGKWLSPGEADRLPFSVQKDNNIW